MKAHAVFGRVVVGGARAARGVGAASLIGAVAMWAAACSSGAKSSTPDGGVGGAAGGLGTGGDDGDAAVDAVDALDAGAVDVPILGPAFTASYHLGADISWVPHDEYYGATYVDTDGAAKDILALLANHGFNSVRLRTFVEPKAADGYDQLDGFADLRHTVLIAERVKKAGMGLLLALHYSDNWADPGKQCIPVAWQGDTFDQLAQHVHDYTANVITTLRNAGARPDLVQIGNEITSGMLIHICDPLGLPVSTNPVNGSAANWTNLGALLKQGIAAVHEVDPTIRIVLHIDKGGDLGASTAWIMAAQAQGVAFDVFADTAYVRWQGQPSGWQTTFAALATAFPSLSFLIPEYGNETASDPATPSTMQIANDTIFGLGSRGIGTWFYEPEHPAQSGVGVGLFMTSVDDAGALQDSWPVFTSRPDAMAVYDQLRATYAGRL